MWACQPVAPHARGVGPGWQTRRQAVQAHSATPKARASSLTVKTAGGQDKPQHSGLGQKPNKTTTKCQYAFIWFNQTAPHHIKILFFSCKTHTNQASSLLSPSSIINSKNIKWKIINYLIQQKNSQNKQKIFQISKTAKTKRKYIIQH